MDDWIKIYPSICPSPTSRYPEGSTNCVVQALLVVLTLTPIAAVLIENIAPHVPAAMHIVHSRALASIHVGGISFKSKCDHNCATEKREASRLFQSPETMPDNKSFDR